MQLINRYEKTQVNYLQRSLAENQHSVNVGHCDNPQKNSIYNQGHLICSNSDF